MKILIACEESQEVCKAFRAKGHEAYSCDMLECSGGHPEWHIMGNVLSILGDENTNRDNDGNILFCVQKLGAEAIHVDKWDMIIAHPPCTYLTNAAARHLYPGKILNKERAAKGFEAKEFFMQLFNAPCDKICVENPIPSKLFKLPERSQIIQPFEHGHPYSKRTCLWLKGLSLLKPSNIVDKVESTKVPGNWFNKCGKQRQINRSKTFTGIAVAMAEQWG